MNYSPVQSYIAKRAAGVLSEKLGTKVDVAHVRIGLLNSLNVEGVYIEDQSKDTLLYAGQIQVRITDWFIFKDKPVLHYVGLKNSYVHLYRGATSKTWNYDFIADAFSSPKKKKKDTSNAQIEIDLKKVELDHVRFHMDDAWIGEDMDYDVGYVLVNTRDVNTRKKIIDIKGIEIRNTSILLNEYTGGRPAHLKPKRDSTFDTTPFNPDMWAVWVKDLSLEGCAFRLQADGRQPVACHFDESHLDIQRIDLAAENISITGDTIHGSITNLTALDRCGLSIKKMRSRVTVSPIASICEDLYMETNHSVIRDYYAMHYKHFPNFNHYIDSVTMVARLKDSKIDKRDIEYFAPELEDFPDMELKVSGKARGTVSNIVAKNLNISDGNISLKGDLTMAGLPDIYTTYITYTNGEILTTGRGIEHYAPALKNNPDIAADSITYAYYMGSYEGYIEDFRVKGTIKTNMGALATDMKMKLPGFDPAVATYDGTINAEGLQLGRLLRQDIVGDISLNEKISGHSFDPELIQLNMDGTIREMGLNGYTYHNITTHGMLAKKQFDGELLVDDPNLALSFNGRLNYADKLVKVNAKANLLGSDLKAMKLTHDHITISGDFDLNCTGSSIDNFSGYAKLFNLDIKKDQHRLGIDSVYVLSAGDSNQRKLDIQSDAFTASINGNYRLSKLPASIQYYLSRYIPNYIKAPAQVAPVQDLSFRIATVAVDSLLALTVPMLRGFDQSVVTGSLNTSQKKLTLNASIPYCSISNIEFRNTTITGDGDYSTLALNTSVGNVSIADSLLSGTLSLTTTVGNDSVLFTLATVAPNRESSLSLNGRITANNDTLQLNVLPSEFYMDKARWTIAGGSNVTYSGKYLDARGILLTSGLQRISVNSIDGSTQSISLKAENIDVAQMENWTGFSDYDPEGRVSGIITVDSIFSKLSVTANVVASGLKLAGDTIGTITLDGHYDGAKEMLYINPKTGIHRDNAWIKAYGTLALDSASKRKLQGEIQFNDARVAWATPFLAGVMSNLSGRVNGKVAVTGSSDKPHIDGALQLQDAGFKLDYMGCTYSIPNANVSVNNERIELGRITIYDSYRNTATLSGVFTHDLFDKMRMRLKVTTPKFEVMNLGPKENDIFYGKLIASMDSFTIRGPFNNIRFNMYNGAPAAKSTIYIPVSYGGYTGTYNYVSFKSYGKEQTTAVKRTKDKIHINIDANLNPLLQMHIVMDPTTEDEIVARGTGNIQIDIPPNNDMKINGIYTVTEGTYTLTFQQFAIHRMFRLNSGSTITFNGPFDETTLAVDAVYAARVRMYDILSEQEKQSIAGTPEARDAQTPQWVNVILHMNGPIYNSKLGFDLGTESSHSQASIAYRKLQIINSNDQQKFDQVAALLLLNQFIPPETTGGGAVRSGTINNVSQILSSTASSALTKGLNKLLGNRNVNVNFKYNTYNYTNEQSPGSVNRNQLKLGVTKNYLDDRLTISVGSVSDWGRPGSSSQQTNAVNVAGDFRMEYMLSQKSGLRVSAFHTSDYDLTINQNIQRTGAGLSWRKSFDNLGDLFGGKEKRDERERKMQKAMQPIADSTAKPEAPKGKGRRNKK